MKKNHYIFIFLIFGTIISDGLYAQTAHQNSVKSIECLDETCTNYKESLLYFDEIARPKQLQLVGASPSGKTIIKHYEYDSFGRQLKDFLPAVSSQSSNSLIIHPSAAYHNTYAPYNTDFFYAEKEIENSPLARIKKQASPGDDWSINSDNTIEYEYSLNKEEDYIRNFSASATWNPAQKIFDITLSEEDYYQHSELIKTIVKDENNISGEENHSVEEYKDRKGQVILKRTFLEEEPVDTYYVYDIYGNLTYVLPPLLNKNNDINSIITKLDDLGYQYKYDSKNRLAEKKLPGKDWENMVYDKQNRLVAYQDGNMKINTKLKWLITKYDEHSRVVYTALLEGSETITRTNLQNNADTFVDNGTGANNEYRTNSSITISGTQLYYTNQAFPATYHIQLLTINYYDDYSNTNASVPQNVLGQSVKDGSSNNLKGLLTTSLSRIDLTEKWQTTYTYYDVLNRPVRTSVSHPNLDQNSSNEGYTQTDVLLDFRGKPNQTITQHYNASANFNVNTQETFLYDAQERLITHKHKIGNEIEETLAQNQYDELGVLEKKYVGGQQTLINSGAPQGQLQKIDYTYNIRGWLTDINSTHQLNDELCVGLKDLFAFHINYNNPQNTYYNVSPLYNGNISETYWRTARDNILRSYGYAYDDLNRLINGYYRKPNQTIVNANNYNERLNYDLNGNILALNRNGGFDIPDGVEGIDELQYTYNNGNQLLKVTDATNSPDGFKDGTNTGNDYTYDSNGNMITDQNKNITEIKYNYLNLPVEIILSEGNAIQYFYNANGVKIRKEVKYAQENTITDYLSGYQYVNNELQFFPTAEGYVNFASIPELQEYNKFTYVYNYTDHLGNIRVSYTQNPQNPDALVILEENNYYPFGLKHNGYNKEIREIEFAEYLATTEEDQEHAASYNITILPAMKSKYKYKYQGQERQDELNLNWDSFKWRNYDYAIGRFMSVDPLSEGYNWQSVYAFGSNQPIHAKEIEGLESEDDKSLMNRATEGLKQIGNAINKVVGEIFNADRAYQKISADANTSAKANRESLAVKAEAAGEFAQGVSETAKGVAYDSGEILNTSGDIIQVGSVCASPFTEGASLALVPPAEAMSDVGVVLKIGVNLSDGKTNEALKDVASLAVSKSIGKVLDKGTNSLIKDSKITKGEITTVKTIMNAHSIGYSKISEKAINYKSEQVKQKTDGGIQAVKENLNKKKIN